MTRKSFKKKKKKNKYRKDQNLSIDKVYLLDFLSIPDKRNYFKNKKILFAKKKYKNN